NEVFQDEISKSKTQVLKASLAKKFRGAASQENGPVTKYALLSRAREIAVEVGDVEGACDDIEELDASFEIDTIKLGMETLTALSKVITTQAQRKSLCFYLTKFTDSAIAEDRHENARALSDLCLSTARTVSDAALLKNATT